MNPHHCSPSTEAALIASILVDPTCLRRLGALEAGAFSNAQHQGIFEAIRNLEFAGEPIDPITVSAVVARRIRTHAQNRDAEAATTSIAAAREYETMAFLASMMLREVGSPSSVENYAATLIRHQVTRDLVDALVRCLSMVQSDHGGIDELEGEGAVQTCRAELAKVQTRAVSSSMSIGKVVEERLHGLDEMEARKARGELVLTGIPTGIAKLDEEIGGYQLQIITLIGGRPRMGKSSVIMAAMQAATAAGIGAHVFSLEDARSSYADRAIANVANVSVTAARQATMQRAEYQEFNRGANQLAKRKNWRYDDKRGRTAPQIVEAWRREGEKNQTKVVAVDYVNKVRPMNARAPKHEQIEETVNYFADACAADDVALLLGAQIGRSATQRAGNRPTLEDLKASGALEEIPKCIVLVHRGAVYGPPVAGVDFDPTWTAPLNYKPDDDEWQGRLELIVAKHSNGAEGDVWAKWIGHRTLAQ